MEHKLLDHILKLINAEHKQLCKKDLPRIGSIFDTLINDEGGNEPDLMDAAQLFDELKTEIEIHVLEEDQFLLPLTKQILHDDVHEAHDIQSVQKTIHSFSHQHDHFDRKCERVIELLNSIHLHDDHSLDKVELVDLLSDVKLLLARHHEKEHHILFPALNERCQELLQAST